jgi:lysozyme
MILRRPHAVIQGIDVFSGYGRICWPLVASSGVDFAYIKCTTGNDGKDPAFDLNVDGARANGVAVGMYHFGYPLPPHPDHPGRAPLEQARAAFEACRGLGADPGELSPALDAEWPPLAEWAKWGCSAAQISEWLHEYCEAAVMLWGRLPVLYTYPDFWRGNGKTYHGVSEADVRWAASYPLWMASYTHPGPGTPDLGGPPVPPPWDDWAVWQYSAEGSPERIPGVAACPVDRDCIRDRSTFLRLTGRSLADPVDREATTKSGPHDVAHPLVPLESPELDDDEPPPEAA